MSKRNDSFASDKLDGSSLDLSEDSSCCDVDSDNSRDVNLNSKKFLNCNLFETELDNRIDEFEMNLTSEIENLNSKFNLKFDKNEKSELHKKNVELNQGNNSEPENSTFLIKAKTNSMPVTMTSTPKAKSSESQILYTSFSVSPENSPVDTESGGQTYLVDRTILNPKNLFTDEEIGKKFQDLSFAFKTDSMTIQKRLQLMKRRRDQAESNIESELKIIRAKLKTLQYLSLNSEFVNLLTDLKKQLDFLLNATLQLSSSAESYGYAQHEERLLELIAVMLQHVENVESSRSDSSKISDKLKEENKRSLIPLSMDNCGDEDKILRRRSLVTIALEGNSRRRASIATLPRIGYSVLENGCNNKGPQCTPNRSLVNAAKKFSHSQAHTNNPSVIDDFKKDLTGARHRRESKTSECSMKNIDEFPEQRSSSGESELIEEPIDSDSNIEVSDSSLHLKQLFGSLEELRRISNTQEHVSPAYCLRRVIEWNKLLISSTRFRWPENVLHFVPFYMTWYVVFVLAFVFIGGLFTGINGCYTYSCLKFSLLLFAATAFHSFIRRFYRILLPLLLTLVLALILFFLWLTKLLLPQLTSEEVDALFKAVGLEIRYLYGPPPV